MLLQRYEVLLKPPNLFGILLTYIEIGSAFRKMGTLIILKNVLLVDSTKHDMIDAGSALCPFLSRHE